MLKKKVLFVCYGGGHSKCIIPVVKELQNYSDHIEIIILALTNAAADFDRSNIDYLKFSDLIEDDEKERIETYGRALIGENWHSNSTVSKEESLAYLGANYLDLVLQYGEDAAADKYSAMGRKSFLPLVFMERFIERIKPSLIVTTSSPRSELATRIVAKDKDIPSLSITDSLEPGKLGIQLYADTLCVISNIAAENWAAKQGVKYKRLVVTGNPSFDALGNYLKGRMSHQTDPSPILFAQQSGRMMDSNNTYHDFTPAEIFEHLSFYDDVCRNLSHPGKVRFHPSLNIETYYQWANSEDRYLQLDREPDVAKSLAYSSAVVGNFTTMLIEALYLERHVMQIIYDKNIKEILPLHEMGLTTPVDFLDRQTLSSALKDCIANPNYSAEKHELFRNAFPPLPIVPAVIKEMETLLQ